jgi:signal transduction histidine kinase
VPREDRERIFERFWHGRAAPAHGAGLGLAIVAEIMKAHGGNVEVNAGPDGGAVFTLVFLPAPAHAPPVAGQTEHQPEAPSAVIAARESI